jgi:hypothetical protein
MRNNFQARISAARLSPHARAMMWEPPIPRGHRTRMPRGDRRRQRVVYWDPANLGAVDYAAMLRGLDGGGDRL